MTPDEIRRSFWFGTQYFRPPTPLAEEWAEDFGKLKTFGLKIIQCRVNWRSYEPREGEYRWDELDSLMDQAGAQGLRMVHQINLENAPHYVYEKYNGYRIDLRGQRIWPIAGSAFYHGGWIPCFDHPDVMQRGEAFVRKLVERYRAHPAMEFWHAWNEPRSRPMGECTCGHSVKSYQEWLAEKYGTVDALNKAYGKSWPAFSAVDAARDTSDFAEMYLWRQWAATRVRDRVERVVAAVRGLDAQHAVISHVGMNNMQQDPLNDISDDNLMCDVADLYGSSFEMRYTPEPIVHSLPFLVCDWMRHICRGKYTIYEIYPSGGRYEPEVPPHQLQQWLWTPPACGAGSEFLWQFKKERVGGETNDAGLIELDGSDNANSVAARSVFADFGKLAGRMAGWRVAKGKIAMVFDLKSDLVGRIEYTASRDADYVGSYKLRFTLADAHLYKAHFQATYHLFWLNNIAVDVTSSDRLEETLGSYDVVYLPSMAIVDEGRAGMLLKFVERGGRLIVDGGFATRSDNSWVQRFRPAFAAGYREKETLIHPPFRETISLAGMELPVGVRRTSFEAGDGEVIGRWGDGTTAGLEKGIGKGKLLALGFLPGVSYLVSQNSAQWREFMDWMMGWAGVGGVGGDGGGAGADMTLREVRDGEGKIIRFAFRRWGVDSATSQSNWEAWGADRELLVQSEFVKCVDGGAGGVGVEVK